MNLLDWVLLSFQAGWYFDTPITTQNISGSSNQGSYKIAVIGAGIAGSSVVSRLSIEDAASAAQITVFEEKEIAGGRIKSVAHQFGEFGALEGGANYFTLEDWCLMDLINTTGVELGGVDPRDRLPPGYYGSPEARNPPLQLSYCDVETTKWRKVKEYTWAYGLSFWRARKTIQQVSQRWRAFLDDRNNADSQNLKEALKLVNAELLASGSEYFKWRSISQRYQNDILRPCAKAKINKHSDESTALESLLADRTLTTTSVRDGNVQLIEQAIKQTPAKVLYNSTVRTITTGQMRAYSLRYSTSSVSDSNPQEAEFDMVVLAAPLTESIKLDIPAHSMPDILPYESRHVTYFATVQPLSGAFQYHYLDVDDITDYTLTASHTRDVNIDAIKMSMKCGMRECDPGDECDDCLYENIYRMVSHEYISDEGLIDLVSPITGCEGEGITLPWNCSEISWVHRFEWPEALPAWQARRPETPDSVEIAPNFFYTSGLEHVVSSMEMSCRMGRHVAGQIQKRL